jgi:putative flippase GtrA
MMGMAGRASVAHLGLPSVLANLARSAGDRLAAARTRLDERFPMLRQLARYALVGGLGTAVNAGVYLALRVTLEPLAANLVALLVSTGVSTEVNRRFTFDGAQARRWRVYVQDAGTVVFYAFYSSAVLLVVDEVFPAVTAPGESVAVALASTLGGLVRFAVLKAWVFGSAGTEQVPEAGPADYGRDDVPGVRDVRPAGADGHVAGPHPRRARGLGAAAAPAPRVSAESRPVASAGPAPGRGAHRRGHGSARVRGLRSACLRRRAGHPRI